MNGEIRDPLCQCIKCFDESKKKELQQVAKNKIDQQQRIIEALAKARQCKFFYHKTFPFFDEKGKEITNAESQMTCSLTIAAKCGHETLKYALCSAWRNGDFCQDWEGNHETT